MNKKEILTKIERIPKINIILDLILSVYSGIFIGFKMTNSIIGYSIVALITMTIAILMELKEQK